MSTIRVSDTVTLHYTDSGPVAQHARTTIFMIHGHSFHSGIFERILPLANLHGFRIICVSRRGYLESTPYTAEEKEIVINGSAQQQAAFLSSQGLLFAMFIDGIIRKHKLPKTDGIALLGWSMGNLFVLAILAAIDTLPRDMKENLTNYLHTCICWDAPNVALGIPIPKDSYFPLWDTNPNITPEEHSATFATWVSGYYQHGDLGRKEFFQLNQRYFDTQIRKPTVLTMSDEEIQSVCNGFIGLEFDSPMIADSSFQHSIRDQTSKALFDPEVKKQWKRLKTTCFMYAESTIWLIIFAMWKLEEEGQMGICYKPIPDANHFMMWDEPERFMTYLEKVISESHSATSNL